MVDAVVSFVVQKLGDYLIQEAALFNGVKDEVEWLKNELEWMQSFLKDAEEKQADDEKVRKWVSEIRDIAYDTEDVLDTYVLQKEHVPITKKEHVPITKFFYSFFVCSCVSKPKKLYGIAKSIESLKTRLVDISRKREIYGIKDSGNDGDQGRINRVARLRELRRTSSYVDQEIVVGFEDDSRSLVAELLKEELHRCVISILGMGGLGKTTVARKVYNSRNVVDVFYCRAWVCVSQEYEPKDVLRRVIKSFERSCTREEMEKIEKMELEDLERYLRAYLTRQRYLVVIDDVWKREAWESLKRAFPDDENGSRVIITTRIKAVAERSDNRTYLHELRFLRPDESWDLFLNKAEFVNNDSANDMEVLGREMVEKCRGLPLAIIVLAGLLSTKKTLQEWQTVRDHLWKNLRKDSIHISHLLSLSFDDLPMELKSCFLFLGLYPEDFVIGTENLIRLWVAEGFIPQEEETMEKVAEYYLNDLINRSILQVERRNSNKVVECRLHDLVRDLAIQRAKEIKFLDIYDGKTGPSSSAMSYASRRVAVHGVNLNPTLLKHWNPNIRTLILFGDRTEYEFVQVISSRFKLLRVLDIYRGPYGHIASRSWILPQEIRKLVHLRYLRFRETLLHKLPSFIPYLRNLQTLIVRGDFFLDLSSEEISMINELRRLRHLHVMLHGDLPVNNFPDIQSWGFQYYSHELEIYKLDEAGLI